MSAAYGVWKNGFSNFPYFLEHCDQERLGKIICVKLSINYDEHFIFGNICRCKEATSMQTGDALIIQFSDPYVHMQTKMLELKDLLEEAGFETKEEEYFDGTQSVYEKDKEWEAFI